MIKPIEIRKITIHAASIILICISTLLLGCSSIEYSTIKDDNDKLRPTDSSSNSSLIVESRIQLRHPNFANLRYILPPGAYRAVAMDSKGIYYACLSGLVFQQNDQRNGAFLRADLQIGGIYFPSEVSEAPKLWAMTNVAGTMNGSLKLEEADARTRSSECIGIDPTAVSRVLLKQAPIESLRLIETSGPEMSAVPQRVMETPAGVVGAALGSAIVTTLAISDDGRINFPAVHVSTKLYRNQFSRTNAN
ncbi:MAG: hypothetical protein U1E77_20675 [Inhella sp.]